MLGVGSLELLGSLARGDARPDSDVDVLVELCSSGDSSTSSGSSADWRPSSADALIWS